MVALCWLKRTLLNALVMISATISWVEIWTNLISPFLTWSRTMWWSNLMCLRAEQTAQRAHWLVWKLRLPGEVGVRVAGQLHLDAAMQDERLVNRGLTVAQNALHSSHMSVISCALHTDSRHKLSYEPTTTKGSCDQMVQACYISIWN
jgi:hypothetical protein